MNCIRCGKRNAEYPFRVLQVLTLHVRDLGGEKRVQALGDFEEYAVCESCAQAKYHAVMEDRRGLLKALLPFAALSIAGLVTILLLQDGSGAFRLLGFGLLAGGLLGIIGSIQQAQKKKRALAGMTQEDARASCAWGVLTENAPKKCGINDITYIPVNDQTLARKNGDLMLLYDLLPQIAVQAWKRLHGVPEQAEAPSDRPDAAEEL